MTSRKRFYDLHERLAPQYEKMAANQDAKFGTAGYRKSILKFASGVVFDQEKVLECGVGTGRNLDLYPPDVDVTAVDYSQHALETAYTKNTSTRIQYKLEDVEK